MKLFFLSVVLPALPLVSGSCTSVTLPPALAPAEAERLAELPLPYSVGVERYESPAYSERLTKHLRDAGVFRHVAPLESCYTPPDLIATVEDTIYGTATIPVEAMLTAGVVPSAVEERHGHAFALAPAARPEEKTMVNAWYRGTTTLGWLALPINASPRYTRGDPLETRRYREMLAYRALVALRP